MIEGPEVERIERTAMLDYLLAEYDRITRAHRWAMEDQCSDVALYTAGYRSALADAFFALTGAALFDTGCECGDAPCACTCIADIGGLVD